MNKHKRIPRGTALLGCGVALTVAVGAAQRMGSAP